MSTDTEAWLKRAKEILAKGNNSREAGPFATSILSALYGPHSPQLLAFSRDMQGLAKSAENVTSATYFQHSLALSTIQNVIGEIENGLIVNVRTQVAGEVLAELVALGKEILEDDTESSKNVSSVLIAAAFEDLIRRMASELAGVTGRPKLEAVITALKTAGILKGGEPGLAQSYLKFRNDSLHADWANVEKSQIQSCSAFIESLLLKHFS